MTTTTEKLKARRAAEQAGAWACYHELLSRNDNPQKSDSDALAELLPLLGLSDSDVEQHAAAVAEATRLVALIPRRAELEGELATLNEQVVAERIIAARAQLVLEKTFQRWNAAGGALVALKIELQNLGKLKRQYPSLLGGIPEIAQ